jgi:hypothetical protein
VAVFEGAAAILATGEPAASFAALTAIPEVLSGLEGVAVVVIRDVVASAHRGVVSATGHRHVRAHSLVRVGGGVTHAFRDVAELLGIADLAAAVVRGLCAGVCGRKKEGAGEHDDSRGVVHDTPPAFLDTSIDSPNQEIV